MNHVCHTYNMELLVDEHFLISGFNSLMINVTPRVCYPHEYKYPFNQLTQIHPYRWHTMITFAHLYWHI